MRSAAPTITVVIPTHNRRETCMLAVRSALAQTRPPVEVIVLADGCDDGTVEAAAAIGDPRVRVLDRPKAPGYGYGHRNEARRLAAGDVVAWLGDDDLYMPDHLERVAPLFAAGVADLVQAAAVKVGPDWTLHAMTVDWGLPYYREQLEREHSRTPMAAVSHLVAPALEVGGWDAEQPRRGDLDLWRRMLAAGARSAMTATPTVIHFRATDRRQSPADRAAQNSRCLWRMHDPLELARLRSELEASHHRLCADVEAGHQALKRRLEATEAALRRSRDAADELQRVKATRWWRVRAAAGRMRARLARSG